MNKDRILQTLKKEVRSLLIASKLGLSVQELEHDYRAMIGSPLPLRSLDYRSTMELLVDMPDVVNIHTNVGGTVMLSAVVNEETKTMAELVSRQKTSCRKRGLSRRHIIRPVSHMDLVRRGRVAPVLPISVKSELRELLSISPLLVSQLESSFYRRFGRSFQYTRYGFYSLTEVLRSVSDFVQVQQTRAGSLLMLKTPVTNRAIHCSNLQYSKPDNLFKGTSSVCVNGDQSSSKVSHVMDSPLPPTVPQSSGLTALDKLFMKAKTEYFANNPSAESLGAVKQSSETSCSRVTTENLENGLTSSFLPSATVQGTADKPVITCITDIKVDTTGSPSLDTQTIKTYIAEPVIDSTLQGLEEKFEKDLKICLSQTRGSFVISDDLRQDIKHVVNKHAEGLPVSHLLAAFKQHIGKDLPYQKMGFMSVLDLVGNLGDLLYLEGSREGQDWRLFDIESKSKKNVDAERIDEKDLVADDSTSKWNFSRQKSEWLKSPGPIPPTDGMSLWSSMDAPLSVSQKEIIPPDAVRQQKLSRLSCMKRGFMIGVYVENVTSPSDFYIRCYSKDTSQKLEDMLMDMRLSYSNEYVSSRYIVPDEYIIVGEIYALGVDGDVWWYRVIIHAVINSEEVQVFYPDFGTLATVRKCWLRFLKACYMTLPAQAVPSSLACLKPVEDQWSFEAIKVFQNWCARGPLVGLVLQYVLDQLCLYLCDTSTDEDIYLHQVLIDKGLASMAPEPAIYKASKKQNPLMQYLIQSSDQPQEILQDTSGQSEHNTTEVLEVQLQEPALQTRVEEDPELEVPCIEPFPVGEDMWDENWSFSGRPSSVKGASKLPSNNAGDHQEEKPKPEEVNDLKKKCHEAFSPPLEEFYISLIESRNTVENSTILQSPPERCDEFEKTPQPAADLQDYSLHVTPEEENMQSLEDSCLFNESSSINQAARAGNPLMGFQKFHIPRSSATFALGPAARLAATPGSLLNWFA
ncbi:tudor domain-containing protein 5 [Eleutherodactylus coqui]|uniref:tudor domain-containing protein 5 n=1 Tax=Eleutherodactylus coqui TaxID=57060 RepID=UPI003461930C